MARPALKLPDLSHQVVEAAPDGVIVYELVHDHHGRAAAFKPRMHNPAAERLLARDEIATALDQILPDSVPEALFREYADVARSGRSMDFDKVIEDGSGTVSLALSISVRAIRCGVSVTVSEATDRTRELRAWKQRSERLELLARRSRDVVSLHTPDGYYVWASDSALRVLGVDAKALLGSHLTERLDEEDAAPLLGGRLPVDQTFRMRAGDTGEERWLEIKLEAHGRHVLALMRDITKLRSLELRAAAADPDGLAGVHGRQPFLAELDKEISRRRRYGRPVCVVAVALDQHKAIVAQRGEAGLRRAHEVFAEAAKEITRTVDVLGKWSDEVFLLLLPETPAVGAIRASERLAERVSELHVDDGVGKPFRMSLSAGVTAVDADDDAKTVLARAGRNLASARRQGGASIRQDSDRHVA